MQCQNKLSPCQTRPAPSPGHLHMRIPPRNYATVPGKERAASHRFCRISYTASFHILPHGLHTYPCPPSFFRRRGFIFRILPLSAAARRHLSAGRQTFFLFHQPTPRLRFPFLCGAGLHYHHFPRCRVHPGDFPAALIADLSIHCHAEPLFPVRIAQSQSPPQSG